MIRGVLAKTCFAVLLGVFFCAGRCLAGGDPVNLILVVNAESPSSKLIANYYAFYRRISPINVVYLENIPRGETIPLSEFKTKILEPIIQAIGQRRLDGQIDYIVYSSDFPTRINAKSDLTTLLARIPTQAGGVPINSKILSPTVSINSATYFYQKILAGDPTYLSLSANLYMRTSCFNLLRFPFVGEEKVQFDEAVTLTQQDQFDEAIELLQPLAEKNPRQVAVSYWLARVYGRKGDVAKVQYWLARAVAGGWVYREYTKTDTAFDDLKEDKDFQETLERIPDEPFKYLPTMAFHRRSNWGPNGCVNGSRNQGEEYVLSTVLAVNRNQGNSERESLDHLLRSIGADGTRPSGKFYFSKTNDIRTKTRSNDFDGTIEELKKLGYASEVFQQRIPKNKRDIVGAMLGTANYVWADSGSKIMSGAICESLTSYGGLLLPDIGQTKLTEFIRHGAAGSSGTVIEPFAIAAKFPHPRMHVHYVKGCSLAESFYQSVQGPFQLLIIGDALCKPWAVSPKLKISGDVTKNEPLSGVVEINLDEEEDSVPIATVDMYIDGVFEKRLTQKGVRLDTSLHADGYHEIRFVATEPGPIETSGFTIVPLMINNRGRSVSLKTDSKQYDIGSMIRFQVAAKDATELQIRFHWQIIDKREGDQAVFEIPASRFGRGPVVVNAIAEIDGELIQSEPLNLDIEGTISTRTPIVRGAFDPKPKPKPPAPPKKGAKKK